MSYLGRLSTRNASSPVAAQVAALRPAIRSQSPIAEIDQRLGLSGIAFDHVPWAVGHESTGEAQAEVSTPSAPTPVKVMTPTPPGQSATVEASRPPPRMAGSAPVAAESASTSELDKSSQKLTQRPVASLTSRPTRASLEPLSSPDPPPPEANETPTETQRESSQGLGNSQRAAIAAEYLSAFRDDPMSRIPRVVPGASAGHQAPESATPLESGKDEWTAANQSVAQTFARDLSVAPGNIEARNDSAPNSEDRPRPRPFAGAETVDEQQAPALLEPQAHSENKSVLGGLFEPSPPQVIIDQLTVEVIPPAAPEDQHLKQPRSDSQNNQPRARQYR